MKFDRQSGGQRKRLGNKLNVTMNMKEAGKLSSIFSSDSEENRMNETSLYQYNDNLEEIK